MICKACVAAGRGKKSLRRVKDGKRPINSSWTGLAKYRCKTCHAVYNSFGELQGVKKKNIFTAQDAKRTEKRILSQQVFTPRFASNDERKNCFMRMLGIR